MTTPLAEKFLERETHYNHLFENLQRKELWISWLRFGIFVVFLIGLVYLANARASTAFAVLLLAFPFVFGLLVNYHNRIRAQRAQAQFLTEINKEEILRLEHRFQSLYNGQAYSDPAHPYAIDMDIFGDNSLYQLICRAHTQNGRNELAEWLLQAVPEKEIENRQLAIAELKHKIDWRQDFEAAGRHNEISEEEDVLPAFLRWLNTPADLLRNASIKLAAYVMPLVTVAVLIALVAFHASYLFIVPVIVVNVALLLRIQPLAKDTHQHTSSNVKLLKAYAQLIALIEQESFETTKLQLLKARFSHEKHTASKEIRKLQQILDHFDSRGNMFYQLFNVFLLLDLQWLIRAERWKQQMQADVRSWFDAISEFEALNSLSGFAYGNPAFVMPGISHEPHTFKSIELAHPLIPAGIRVANDFELNGKGHIAIITGSNMSGKSTFERTVGVNIVLALAGAPVCAKMMKVSVSQLFSSMRTTDSLEESVSSFYAELRRLRQLLDTLQEDKPVFFLLDEILKGTNSIDRHKGAEGLIHQLSELNASGMVSTHDLALSRLAEEMKSVVNFSFESQIEGDEILFDYHLKNGACRSFNASKLMEKMGIRVAEGESNL